ncbi:MAG: single-stranded-DNA-specific exonuclease RecJ [Bacteroidetes bacterium]|nr:single-stranded-DNA-specific exonuclease RecJ [Bacteroidota bacterium]
MQKKWKLKKSHADIVQQLQNDLKIHPVLCELLQQREINTYEQARQFFRTSEEHLHDPFLMKGMDIAVTRIHQAIENKERILIYGDYDVDGTTSVAVVYSYLQAIHPDIEYYIPHRFTEGYGMSNKGIEYAIANHFTLIITLDCGVKSIVPIHKAKANGIDTIVCDHHLPDDDLPDAIAILNPKQADCPYPYKELCGCGIGYKLISAYALKYQANVESVHKHLDLVATAIAADIVPITGENRTLCVLGLQKANANPCISLQALRYINALQKEFTINDLVFIIAPRVNAAGRMDDARKAVDMFIAPDLETAKEYANLLHEDNLVRRDIDKQITAEALELVDAMNNDESLRSTVVYHPDWHKGVVGIVASRLIEHHYRPTIVLTKSEGKVSGSARSIKGFNLFDGLNQCAEYLENWGGHYFAAGLTMKEENLNHFTAKFNEVVIASVPEEMFQPVIEIDAELQLKDINESFLQILKQFAPHGPENMKPIFLSTALTDFQDRTTIVKEQHVRFSVQQANGKVFNGIGFNLADKMPLIKSKSSFDILYHLEENEFNGNTSIQLKVIDVR